jgi:hypothetical protein
MEIHPKTLASIEAILEPGESIVFFSDWYFTSQVWVNGTQWIAGHYKNVENGCSLILTQDNMYFMQFRVGFGGKRVSNHWSRPFSTLTSHNFIKNKTNKGVVTGYGFVFDPAGGLPGGTLYNKSESEADQFMEIFRASVARFQSVASSPNFADQISAMTELYNQGVLSAEEFQRAKELFIGKAPSAELEMQKTLLNLKQLKDAGVLTEAEYATKKWALLSGS